VLVLEHVRNRARSWERGARPAAAALDSLIDALELLHDDLLHDFGFEAVLGTTLDVTLVGAGDRADEACAALMREIARLDGVYSRYDEASDLRRWLRNDPIDPGSPLWPLLEAAMHWAHVSGGAFHPGAAAAGAAWEAAAEHDAVPCDIMLARLAKRLEAFSLDRSSSPPPFPITLDAIAKGAIVDAAAAAAAGVPGIMAGVVALGGDVRAWGERTSLVAISDPAAWADNAPPLAFVRLAGDALATSGARHRGWRIGGRWYSHLLDPRTGRPVDHVASATALAPTCLESDAMASAACVLTPDESLTLADASGMGLLLVLPSGEILANDLLRDRMPCGTTHAQEGITRG
jgi:FAD:protein FMN transferase